MGCNSPPDNRSKHQDSHQEYHHPLETCYDLVVDELKLDDQGSTLVAHPANPLLLTRTITHGSNPPPNQVPTQHLVKIM